MTVTLLIGFAAVGGILLGYCVGRVGRGWMVPMLWAISAATVAIYAIWLDVGEGRGAAQSAFVLFGMLIPFAACAVVSSMIGVAVRRVVTRAEDERP